MVLHVMTLANHLSVMMIIFGDHIFRWLCCFCLCGALCTANHGGHRVNSLQINFDPEFCYQIRIKQSTLWSLVVTANFRTDQPLPICHRFLATLLVGCCHQMWIIVLSNNSVFNWDFQIIMDHNINQLNNTPKPMGTKIALKSLYG